MNDLQGLVAIVTGGASGIGRAVIEQLSAAGARVAVLDRERAVGVGEISLVCDVREDASVRTAVGEAARALGALDIVVNNAGIGAQGTVSDNDDAEWHRVFDVNVVGIARVTRAALPYLKQSSRAAVVNTSSVVASAGVPNRALYSAAKGAVQALTLAMAADYIRGGIRVNCVSPGTTDTPWVRRLLDSAADPVAERAALEARQPIGRLVTADEVAHAVCYLASPQSGSTTGTVLAVDGGMYGLRVPRG